MSNTSNNSCWLICQLLICVSDINMRSAAKFQIVMSCVSFSPWISWVLPVCLAESSPGWRWALLHESATAALSPDTKGICTINCNLICPLHEHQNLVLKLHWLFSYYQWSKWQCVMSKESLAVTSPLRIITWLYSHTNTKHFSVFVLSWLFWFHDPKLHCFGSVSPLSSAPFLLYPVTNCMLMSGVNGEAVHN